MINKRSLMALAVAPLIDVSAQQVFMSINAPISFFLWWTIWVGKIPRCLFGLKERLLTDVIILPIWSDWLLRG